MSNAVESLGHNISNKWMAAILALGMALPWERVRSEGDCS